MLIDKKVVSRIIKNIHRKKSNTLKCTRQINKLKSKLYVVLHKFLKKAKATYFSKYYENHIEATDNFHTKIHYWQYDCSFSARQLTFT